MSRVEMQDFSFEQLADFVRKWALLRNDKQISLDTQFERDLGITGDDGIELLEALQERYGIEFTSESFGLESNEYVFHSEGFGLFPIFFQSLFGKPIPEVRSFTVGELYEAVLKELDKVLPAESPRHQAPP
jgi:acyl carrier protein